MDEESILESQLDTQEQKLDHLETQMRDLTQMACSMAETLKKSIEMMIGSNKLQRTHEECLLELDSKIKLLLNNKEQQRSINLIESTNLVESGEGENSDVMEKSEIEPQNITQLEEGAGSEHSIELKRPNQSIAVSEQSPQPTYLSHQSMVTPKLLLLHRWLTPKNFIDYYYEVSSLWSVDKLFDERLRLNWHSKTKHNEFRGVLLAIWGRKPRKPPDYMNFIATSYVLLDQETPRPSKPSDFNHNFTVMIPLHPPDQPLVSIAEIQNYLDQKEELILTWQLNTSTVVHTVRVRAEVGNLVLMFGGISLIGVQNLGGVYKSLVLSMLQCNPELKNNSLGKILNNKITLAVVLVPAHFCVYKGVVGNDVGLIVSLGVLALDLGNIVFDTLLGGKDLVRCIFDCRDASYNTYEDIDRSGDDQMQERLTMPAEMNFTKLKRYGDGYNNSDVVVATRTNATYVESTNAISKWQGLLPKSGEMVFNIEWGNFRSSRVPLTEFDESLDSDCLNLREQIFENMISGMFWGEIVRQVLLKMGVEAEFFGDFELTKPQIPDVKVVATKLKDIPELCGIFLRADFFNLASAFLNGMAASTNTEVGMTKKLNGCLRCWLVEYLESQLNAFILNFLNYQNAYLLLLEIGFQVLVWVSLNSHVGDEKISTHYPLSKEHPPTHDISKYKEQRKHWLIPWQLETTKNDSRKGFNFVPSQLSNCRLEDKPIFMEAVLIENMLLDQHPYLIMGSPVQQPQSLLKN